MNLPCRPFLDVIPGATWLVVAVFLLMNTRIKWQGASLDAFLLSLVVASLAAQSWSLRRSLRIDWLRSTWLALLSQLASHLVVGVFVAIVMFAAWVDLSKRTMTWDLPGVPTILLFALSFGGSVIGSIWFTNGQILRWVLRARGFATGEARAAIARSRHAWLFALCLALTIFVISRWVLGDVFSYGAQP